MTAGQPAIVVVNKLSTPPDTKALSGARVLMIVENLPVPFDRRVWQEALALRDAGAKVAIISPKSPKYREAHEVLEGISIYRHALPVDASGAWGYLAEYVAALFGQLRLSLKVAREHGIDIIHACNPPDLIFLVAMLFKPFGVRFLFDHHDLSPELYEAKFNKRGAYWRLLRWTERLTFAMADVIISTNESYRRVAIERGRKDPGDVFVVRSAPRLDKFKPLPANEKWRNGRKFLVGYVGVMGSQEGIELLLESVAHIVQDLGRNDIQFCLAGAGPQFENLKQLASQLGVADYVSFLGRVSDEVLIEVLCSSDVCVNPDRFNEMNDKSTMNKIMEYMALRRPIVQFDLTEGRVSAGGASLYARHDDVEDFADKIVGLLADPAAREQMGQIGFDRVLSSLNWEEQVPQLIGAYVHALRGRLK